MTLETKEKQSVFEQIGDSEEVFKDLYVFG